MDCPFTPISGLRLIGGVAATGPMFASDRLVFTFRQREQCAGDRTREIPYPQLADLLKPEVLRLAQGR
ncbi:hypothetical protein [Thermomonospora amylolytica]|uniref:hypothetical protein n=1 Tax=Thermomonospora amylolytica TaxID=1411117 RepID=UPI000E6D1059|nr:hypothetical protein [Thermomonospora amylolytica]